jgi:CheY-like chemotaxis protein
MGNLAAPLNTLRTASLEPLSRAANRILVVEDDPAVQKALRRLFETEGYAVETQSDGKSALDSFRALAPAAIVLLSDGAQNRGRLQPIQAALEAKRLKVPVYTVALGTPNGKIKINDGTFSTVITVPPDPQTLRQIALETGGQFYSAASSARLNAVYGALASRIATRKEYTESTNLFLGAASVLLVAAGLAAFAWLPKLP